MSNGDQTPFTEKFLELKYSTLRKEIETCQNRHFRIVAGALFFVPAVQVAADIVEANGSGFLGLTLVALTILAPLPLIFLVPYIRFFHEHRAIERCATYMRKHIEPAAGAKGWETWLSEQNDDKLRELERGEVTRVGFLYGTMFLFSVVLAVQYVYVVFSGLLSDTAPVTVGWTAVGLAVLFYAGALLCAKRAADRLKGEVYYLS